MRYFSVLLIFTAGLLVSTDVLAGEATPELAAAVGTVEKAEKDALTIQPRGPGGKFAKKIVLKITGTSKLTMVSQDKRGGKLVPVQREVEAKDLEINQHVAVIFVGGTDPILLSAVVQRAK
jgi:hypothetical protein